MPALVKKDCIRKIAGSAAVPALLSIALREASTVPLPDGEDGSMELQEGSRVLDIERAVNGGVAIGVLLCVHETDPKQVDVRYDDGTCRRLLPKSRFKLLVEPSVREGP